MEQDNAQLTVLILKWINQEELSQQEQIGLDAWLNAHPDNREYFNELTDRRSWNKK
jgi:hypothetical protein